MRPPAATRTRRARESAVSEQAIPAGGTVTAPPAESRPPKVRTRQTSSLFEPSILRRAIGEAFVKLDPRKMVRIPVMFVVEIGSVITSVDFFARPDLFVGLVTLWLWATVLFANFAEAVAEGRGKAQADTLRRSRKETFAQLLKPDGTTQEIRRPSCGRATSLSSPRARSFPVTATSCRGWPSLTSRRSPVSP